MMLDKKRSSLHEGDKVKAAKAHADAPTPREANSVTMK
jgi:hypothetical protein